MKKKILSVVLALVLCLGIFPAAVLAKETTYLKDMIGTFSGTYVFSNVVNYGGTIQDEMSVLTLNENELCFESSVVYHDMNGSKIAPCGIASKFRFDATGYNDWEAFSFVAGKPQYVEGGLIADYKIEKLLEETEVVANKSGGYTVSLFGMIDFEFNDIVDGKAQKAIYRGVELERSTVDNTADSIITITTVAAPTLLTPSTTEWSGWMLANGKINNFSGANLTEDTNIILADGAELLVGGSINCNGHILNIFAQNNGENTGIFTVKGTVRTTEYVDPGEEPIGGTYCGIDGDITVNGGIVNITGGAKGEKGYPGIRGVLTVANGDVTVTGGSGHFEGGAGVEGGVVISGGKAEINGGKASVFNYQVENKAPGVKVGYNFFDREINVSGGELYINGSGKGVGVENAPIAVTGGKAIINGGEAGGLAYNNDDWGRLINAKIEISFGDGIYEFFHYYSYNHVPQNVVSMRLTPEITEAVAGDNDTANPKTGDESFTAPWLVLLALSSMGLCTCLVFGKKKNNL